MNNPIKQLAIALAFLCVSLPSFAVPVVYDFTDTQANNPFNLPLGLNTAPIMVTQDGLTATIRGLTPANVQADLDRLQGFGFGVAGGPNGNSTGGGEAIEISFLNEVVAIESLLLEGGRNGGSINVLVDGMLEQVISWVSTGTVMEPLNNLRGSTFRFVGLSGGYRMAGFTVEVPAPATLALFGLGLVALRLSRMLRNS